MNKKTTVGMVAAVAAVSLAGCAVPGGYQDGYQQGYQSGYQPGYQGQPSYRGGGYQGQQAQGVLYGRVESIETVPAQNDSPNLLGTVVGGAAGGLLGNQVGGGRGRTAATIGGAVIGALAGNQIEKQMGAGNVLYRINVRLDDGRLATVTQTGLNNLQVGMRAQVANNTVTPY